MAPATPLVPIRARRPPIRVASLQDILDAGEVGHDFFPEQRGPDVRTGALYLDRLGGLRGQEVDDGFVVDSDPRIPNKEFAGCVLDIGEGVFHRSTGGAGLVVVSGLESAR